LAFKLQTTHTSSKLKTSLKFEEFLLIFKEVLQNSRRFIFVLQWKICVSLN